MRKRHIVATLTIVAAALLSAACSNEKTPPWEVSPASGPAAVTESKPTPVPATPTAAPSISISTAPVAEKELSVAGDYPRWEVEQINFNPGTLNPTGGKITATIKTSDKEAPAVAGVTFKLTRPDGSTEDKPGASCGTQTQSGVASRCWEVAFDIPKNEGSTPQEYKVTSFSPSVPDTRSGAFTLPVATASKSCTGIQVEFD